MHFATELVEFYSNFNGRVLTWYILLIGWVLHGLLPICHMMRQDIFLLLNFIGILTCC